VIPLSCAYFIRMDKEEKKEKRSVDQMEEERKEEGLVIFI
jgi:hypothetical protein